MDKVQSAITSVADETLHTLDDTEEFITQSFSRVLALDSVNSDNSQARAKITGVVFELCLDEIFTRFFSEVEIKRHQDLPEAGLVGNSAVDFLVYDSAGQVIGAIEAKGSPEQITTESGETISLKRPGMKRSDTVKKAVSLGYQIQQTYNIPYYILTTNKPTSGSAKKTADIAEGDVIQQLVDVTNSSEVSSFREELSKNPEYTLKLINGSTKTVSETTLADCINSISSHSSVSDIYVESENEWLSKLLEQNSSLSFNDPLHITVESNQLCIKTDRVSGAMRTARLDIPKLDFIDSYYEKGNPVLQLQYDDMIFRKHI